MQWIQAVLLEKGRYSSCSCQRQQRQPPALQIGACGAALHYFTRQHCSRLHSLPHLRQHGQLPHPLDPSQQRQQMGELRGRRLQLYWTRAKPAAAPVSWRHTCGMRAA